MYASQEERLILFWFDRKSLPKQVPSCLEVRCGPSELEVVHVQNHVQLKLGVKVRRGPLRANGQKTHRTYMLITVLLPKGSAIWMAIQRLLQTHNWLQHVRPSRIADFGRQANPTVVPFQVGLDVCLLRVRDLGLVAWHAAVAVTCTRGIHRRGCVPHVLEDRGLPVLVHNTVPLEHDTSFELPGRMVGREFGILFDTNAEQVTKLNLCLLAQCFGRHVTPFAHGINIPHAFVDETLPLAVHRCLGSGSARDLNLVDRTGN